MSLIIRNLSFVIDSFVILNPLKTFTLYRSSAGSGKTRTLAKEYLKLALQNKAYYFRHILAVTFANKATQEMKDRILSYLDSFANGRFDPLADELKQELKLDAVTFRQNCTELQSEILHHYDQFSISTIDAFFQRVIRSFTRESGLIGDYRLEVDQDAVMEEVINNLMDELGTRPELTRWVVEFAMENLENNRAWDVRTSLKEFASEIFREEFKTIEEEVRRDSANPEFFINLKSELWKVKNTFIQAISKPASEVLQIIDSRGWQDSDFSYGRNSGIRGFFGPIATQKSLSAYKEPSGRMRDYFTKAKNWPGKNSLHAPEIIQEAESHFVPNLNRILEYFDAHYQKALSAEVALQNMYVFGLLSDIARKLRDYKIENNLMLLSDAPQFLNHLIGDSDTPFIYEKIGSFYRNYLIDEFQDTSGFQWKNFLPLLTNGLDQGYPSLVVGDVKQAIYRWRSGDLNLLEHDVERLIGAERVEVKELARNFRSAKNIIEFNNALFETAASVVAMEAGSALPASAYRDVSQALSKDIGGFVTVSLIKDEEGRKWKEQSLERIPQQLEDLQRLGVALSEIAILVRINAEGQLIANHLLEYKNSDKAQPGLSYDVVSNESLRMDGAATVNLLLGAMQYLLNPDDAVARARLSFEYAKLHEPGRNQVEVFAVSNQVFFESQLPDSFTREKLSLKRLPLFELSETLIEIFRLGKVAGELSYLQAFQDFVLEFYSRERNDLAAFLEHWEENKNKEKASIKVSGEVDAVRILSIHKAKGLQFKYVIVPFCSWTIDHSGLQAPNLWVTSKESPFDKAGYLPLSYSKKLSDTFFKASYEEEKTRTFLDNLNLLYVALTRAEVGMMITAPDPSQAKATVARWLYESITRNDQLKSYWNETNRELRLGDQKAVTSEKKILDAHPVHLESYPSSRWRDKLVIRQTGSSFFQAQVPGQRERINYGIHLHVVLSRIQHSDDMPAALDRLVVEGMIVEAEKAAVQQQLEELLGHPVVSGWFGTDWMVRTEVPILLPGGGESRIDRLMTSGGKAIVVDFKTGEKSKLDQKQVLEYMETLKKMDFKEVEGYLLYTRDHEVVSVGEGKAKAMKKKDKRQLGLDF